MVALGVLMTKEHPSQERGHEFRLSSGQHRTSPTLPELCIPKERGRNREVYEGLSMPPIVSVKGKIIKSVQ